MGNSEGAEDSVSHLSMCPSGSTGLWWDDQPDEPELHTCGFRAPPPQPPLELHGVAFGKNTGLGPDG